MSTKAEFPRPNRKRARREAAQVAARQKRRSVWIAIVAIAASILAVFAVTSGRHEPSSTVEAVRAAPDFELTGLDGAAKRLSDYRGRAVAVTFMHTY